MSLDKIFTDPHALQAVLEEKKRQGATVVFANGCFELLHVGHVRYLYGAKALGDLLVVAINSDESMKRVKPDRRPVNPDYERYELLSAFECVDYIVPLVETTPVSLLELLQPQIHTKGTDYKLEDIPELPVVEAYGGKVMLVGDPKDHSTTDMLKALRGE